MCLQSCICCVKSHCYIFTKLNITHWYGQFFIITPTRCNAAIQQHTLSCSKMLWNNEISLTLVKRSSKYKAQVVSLLLTELLTEIFIIRYIDWSSYRWNFTNWYFRELSFVTNKFTGRYYYIRRFSSLFYMSTIKTNLNPNCGEEHEAI